MDNYNIKDVSKKVKDRLYSKYPNYSFSVTSERGMTDSLYIYWLGADFNPFIEVGETDIDVNTYYVDNETRLIPKGLDVVKEIYKIAKEYQTSYERGDNHRVKNFYLNIKVGKWDKPFTVTEPTTKSVSSNRGKGWEWGVMVRSNNGWTLYTKTLEDGRIVYNLVKEKSTQANKEQWNEIRGEVYTETGFKWSPKTQTFQYWGELAKKDNYFQTLATLFLIMGKYYGTTTPSTATTTSKQNLTDKSPATAFDIVYRENQEDFDLSNDYNMFAERMSLKYLMNADQWNYLLSEFEKKGNKEFVVNESYKSIPDNPKLDFFTIKDSEGLPEYVELLPRTFKSFKQATKFIADNIGDLEKRGYDKHYVEWKFVYDVAGNEVFADRWDVGLNDANPNRWSNLWAYEQLVSSFFDALYQNRPVNDSVYQEENAFYEKLGKEGMELTKEEFYKIVNYVTVLDYYDVKKFPNYKTESSRLQRIKEVFPLLFSIFDKEQAITAEVIEMKIKALSVLAKYGDELAAKKIKVLQILLKK
jgi:hypothetical protein